MILDGPNNIDLALGTDRRIMQDGDTQLVVPPTILPSVLSLRPHVTSAGTLGINDRSRLISLFSSQTNQAATSTLIVNLPKGLYELELMMATFTNFNHVVGGGPDSSITLESSAIGLQAFLVSRFAVTNLSAQDYVRYRLLLPVDTNLRTIIGVTGVGQSIDQEVTLNVIRIL